MELRRAWVSAGLAAVLAGQAAFGAAPADPVTASICDVTAERAARAHGVPVPIMRALTRTETGRAQGGELRPWPWTINLEGDGFWFETRQQALDFALRHHGRGARSFDVGCFQINFRWHGEAFESISMMFDQTQNADYAARFLQSLKQEGGTWDDAVGKYHSRTPEFATRYLGRFQTILANLGPDAPMPPAPPELSRELTPVHSIRAIDPESQTAFVAGLALQVGRPRHTRMPGGVRLSAFSDGTGLLRSATPLFQRPVK
ncbi:MAG: lytic transglycosylase domain-containing protein [Pseudomonadota bacterium]